MKIMATPMHDCYRQTNLNNIMIDTSDFPVNFC